MKATPMDKTARYEQVRQQLAAVFADEGDGQPVSDMVKMVTINAILKNAIPTYDWVGFYLKTEPDLLEVGPYQGSVGCFFIKFGQGVCGTAAAEGKTVVVPNVHEFPGHIACDAATQSEIVVPFYRDGELLGVFDVDSNLPAAFDAIDQHYLEQILMEWFDGT